MEIWQLFGGLIITLIIASSIGYGLKFKVGFSTPHAVIDNLNARINAWWVMILIIFASNTAERRAKARRNAPLQ